MAGEDWSAPWGGTRSMWLNSIFPRIGHFLPADRIVEIGCGYGRIAKVLHAFTASELVLLDTRLFDFGPNLLHHNRIVS